MTEVKAEVPMAEMLDLRARPALDDRRPGRVHDRVPPLRGGPGAPRAEGRAEARRGGGRGQGARLHLLLRSRAAVREHVATSAPTRATSPATSAGARCCAASTPSRSWPAASAARSASCAPPAPQHEGWIREAGADELHAAPLPPARAAAGFLARRAGAPRARPRGRPSDAAAEDAPGRAPTARRAGPRAAAPRRAGPPRARATCARCRPTPSSRCERALDVFNASEHTRTVGGVARSLGAPAVCARPLADRPSVVAITVDVGAAAGTASRSTSPTRPAASAGSRRAPSSPSSTPRSRSSTPRRTSAEDCTSPPANDSSTDDRVHREIAPGRIDLVIYCVVPEPLAAELYDQLADYYEDDPNVDGDRRPPQERAPRPRGRHGRRPARDARPAARRACRASSRPSPPTSKPE